MKNAPDAHAGTRNAGQLDGAGETLVTLGVIVLQTDLELDGLEEVPLLLVLGVVEQLLDILAHSGCSRRANVSLRSLACAHIKSASSGGRENSPTVIFDMMATVFQKNSLKFLW